MLETFCPKASLPAQISPRPRTFSGLHFSSSSDQALPSCCCLLQTHLPGYVSDSEKFKKLGVEVVVCVAVNDAFVMSAWGEANQASGKVGRCCNGQVKRVRYQSHRYPGCLGCCHAHRRYSGFAVDGLCYVRLLSAAHERSCGLLRQGSPPDSWQHGKPSAARDSWQSWSCSLADKC